MLLHEKLQFILLLEFSLLFGVMGNLAESPNTKGILLILQIFAIVTIYLFVQRLK
jgi:hypothetical protein